MQTGAQTPTDVKFLQARAILSLERQGWDRDEILRALGISEATYRRRLGLLVRFEDERSGR